MQIVIRIMLISLTLLFTACNSTSSEDVHIGGVAQKGPFKKGSTVTAYKIINGERTSQKIETLTMDDKGSYSVDISWNGMTEIEIKGDYFDENTGTYVENGVLCSFLNVSSTAKDIVSNINILTDLHSKNIIGKLKNNPQLDILTIEEESKTNITRLFNLSNNNFEKFNLTDSEDKEYKNENAQLLKLSATMALLDNPNDVLTKFSADMIEDGVIDGNATDIFNEFKNKEQNINLDVISNTLKNKFNIATVPTSENLKGTLSLNHNIHFDTQTETELGSFAESNVVVISGINGDSALLSIDKNSFYSVNEQEYSQLDVIISNGDTLKIKHNVSEKNDETTVSTINIGGAKFSFVSRTTRLVSFGLGKVSYSFNTKTKDNVEVTIPFDADNINTPDSWKKHADYFSKIYTSNMKESVIFINAIGKKEVKTIEITNIDKIAPVISDIKYNITSSTNQAVRVSFTSSDTDLVTPRHWTKEGNTYYRDYSQNTTENVTLSDDVGNSIIKEISILNIDTSAGEVSDALYSSTIQTNEDVTVTFTTNDLDIQTPASWTKVVNGFTKVFTQNTSETVLFQDNAGNSISKKVEITNIDKVAPIVSDISYSITSSTNQAVRVSFTSSDTDLVTPRHWTKEGNTYYRDYSQNTTENITLLDDVGNSIIKEISILNIDTSAGEVSDALYSSTIQTNEDVTVTFTTNDLDIQTPASWTKTVNGFTKVFTQNTSETVLFQDNAGNSISKKVEITNIDKVAPTVSDAIYSDESTTRDPIIVTFTIEDNDVLILEGWTKVGNQFTKTFTNNTNQTIIFKDNVGNETSKKVIITNIDTSNPDLISYDGKDYIQVTSPKTGKIWLDRNLGANEVCNGSNDALCVGDYFQWGRKLNGHEKQNSLTSNELITSDVLTDGKFITVESAPFHWEDAQRSDELWTGTNAINNVCPSGFKVPNKYELEAEFTNNSTVNPKDSFLKIPASSYRSENGSINLSNTNIYLWTSDSKSSLISFDAYVLKFSDKISFTSIHTTKAIPLRCIKDYEDTVSPSIVSIKSGNKILNNNDINISVVDDITIEFSEEIRTEDIAINVILKKSGSNALSSEYANKIVTFNKRSLDTLLEKGYEYTLSITTNIKDISGNNIETDLLITFETEVAPDTTLPMIDFTNSTLDGSSSNLKNSNVSVSNEIKIIFNESIDESTITKNNILLDNGANYSVGLENNNELIITLDENLSYETTYTLELKQDIQDLAGNALNPSTWGNNSGNKSISFTTEDAPDLTAPQVLSSNPTIGDSDIGISSNITVTFDEEITDYNSSTVILKKDIDDTVIASILSYNNKVLTINPNTDLEEATSYKLMLNKGIKDSSNNSLENDIEITFTTGTSTSCSGAVINNICYESSQVQKNWADANNACLSENKTLVTKDLISDLDLFVSTVNLDQSKQYWLNEESSYYANYIEYYTNPYSTDKWKITTSGSKSNDKYFLCMKDSLAPTTTVIKPIDLSAVSTKASFKISFDEEVKNINNTTVILKDSSDSVLATTVTYSNKIVSIKPKNDLETSTEYTITLKSTITDLYANTLVEKAFTFTSNAIATTCNGVELNGICYEKSDDELTYELAKNTCESENKTLISKDSISDWPAFASALELDENKKYWLEENLNYLYKSYSGWSTSSHYSSSTPFSYICKSEKTAPTISSSTPTNDSVNISTKASIIIAFDKNIKKETLNSSNIILKKDGIDSEIETTFTYENKIITIKNKNDFEISSIYTIILKDGITDVYGNNLAQTSISFTTSNVEYSCSGTIIDSKCYSVSTTNKTYEDALNTCSLINRNDISGSESDFASKLGLEESKSYWLSDKSYVIKKGYFNWESTTVYDHTNYYICVE